MTELYKQRIRVTFDFDVTVDDAVIRNTHEKLDNDTITIEHDIALLQQFLKTNPEKLHEMLVYQIASYLGDRVPEDFEEYFFGKIKHDHYFDEEIFHDAIDTLPSAEREYWQDIRNSPPDKRLGSVLSMWTEQIVESFKTKLLGGHIEELKEKE
jgi:hypothetical protein